MGDYNYRGYLGVSQFKKADGNYSTAAADVPGTTGGCINNITIDDAKTRCYETDDCKGFYSKKGFE